MCLAIAHYSQPTDLQLLFAFEYVGEKYHNPGKYENVTYCASLCLVSVFLSCPSEASCDVGFGGCGMVSFARRDGVVRRLLPPRQGEPVSSGDGKWGHVRRGAGLCS